jgi:hypothetical protein
MTFEPYEPPAAYRDARPAAIRWFRVYAATMATASLALFVFGAASGGFALCVASTALIALYAVAACVPFKPWGWTLALVAIAVGVAGVGALVAVPLLILWVRPTVKAAFGRM